MIVERKGEEQRRRLQTAQAVTRTLASFIAAGPSKANITAAARVQFVKDEAADLPSTERIERLFGG